MVGLELDVHGRANGLLEANVEAGEEGRGAAGPRLGEGHDAGELGKRLTDQDPRDDRLPGEVAGEERLLAADRPDAAPRSGRDRGEAGNEAERWAMGELVEGCHR